SSIRTTGNIKLGRCMRIISDFHDYYDCIQKFDQDRSIIYNRQSEFPKEYDYGWPFSRPCGIYDNLEETSILIVGFCGKIYPIINTIIRKFNGKSYDTSDFFLYSIEEVDVFVDAHYNKKAIENYYNKKRRRYFSNQFERENVLNFFEESNKNQCNYKNLF